MIIHRARPNVAASFRNYTLHENGGGCHPVSTVSPHPNRLSYLEVNLVRGLVRLVVLDHYVYSSGELHKPSVLGLEITGQM